MSDVNLDFTVSNNSIVITPFPNDITITPNTIDLTISTTGGLGIANALNANIANVHIYDGTNGQYLQTDGAGNLTWSNGGGSGNGVVGGVNTQVQFNDNGNFGGNVGFTFDKVTGNVSIPNNMLSNTANISNVVITGNGINTPGYYGDITGGNLFSAFTMNASVSMAAPNIAANILTANYIQGATSIAIYSNVTSGYNISAANIIGASSVTSTGNITSNVGVGFSTGGTVTQLTSRTTPVTLDKPTGQITLVSASLAANTSSSFVLSTSYVLDTDLVIVQHISGGTLGKYNITATPAIGSVTITLRNNSSSASGTEQPVLKFMIFRAVNS
jgi:hypothetical protein